MIDEGYGMMKRSRNLIRITSSFVVLGFILLVSFPFSAIADEERKVLFEYFDNAAREGGKKPIHKWGRDLRVFISKNDRTVRDMAGKIATHYSKASGLDIRFVSKGKADIFIIYEQDIHKSVLDDYRKLAGIILNTSNPEQRIEHFRKMPNGENCMHLLKTNREQNVLALIAVRQGQKTEEAGSI